MGTKVLITGAGRGIGAAIAEKLACEGSEIALVARSEDQLMETAKTVEQAGGKARVFAADLSEAGLVHEMANQILKEFGRVDVLVNNAGMMAAGNAAEMDLEAFDKMVAVNLTAPVHLCRRVAPEMIENGEGAIINIGSAASREGIPGISGYCATKFALAGYTESLYKELKQHNVKVSLINPGYVSTDLSKDFDKEAEKMIQPGDIADTVQYILDSSQYVCPWKLDLSPHQMRD